ncbi:MAG: hypothetical protein JWQ32_2076 [Marmoricola sp.]|nr:hypothetical protein [Marmoricola sp.]
MTTLPVPSSPSDQWVLNDYKQVVGTSPAAPASGITQLTFGPVPDNQMWLLDRITVSCNSAAVTTCTLYLDIASDPLHALDYTPSGNYDVADEAAAIQIPTNSSLIVQWTGATPGAVGNARAQLRVLLRNS